MMFAVEINFWTREVTIGGPNELIWVSLSTAIVFGLAFSKLITLGLVPAMLALPYRIRIAARHGRQSRLVRGHRVRCPPGAVSSRPASRRNSHPAFIKPRAARSGGPFLLCGALVCGNPARRVSPRRAPRPDRLRRP